MVGRFHTAPSSNFQANAVEEEELLLVNEEQLEEERRLHEEREREAAAGQVCPCGVCFTVGLGAPERAHTPGASTCCGAGPASCRRRHRGAPSGAEPVLRRQPGGRAGRRLCRSAYKTPLCRLT